MVGQSPDAGGRVLVGVVCSESPAQHPAGVPGVSQQCQWGDLFSSFNSPRCFRQSV